MSAAAAKRMPLVWFTVFALAAFALAGGSSAAPSGKDRSAPTVPTNLRVSAATTTTVTVAWDPAPADSGVVGYYVYGDRGKATVDTNLDKPQYTVRGLACGQSVLLTVVAVDASQNRSEKATATVSASPCLDTQPPTSPSGFTQAATSQTAVVLVWSPSYDNVGVVGYDVYRNLQRVASPTDPAATLAGLSCGSSYQYTVDALDAAGNHSLLAMTYVKTGACPTSSPPAGDTQAPTTPSGLAASNVAQTGLTLGWNSSSDNVGVTGYDVYRDGTKVASPTSTNASLSGLTCATSYAFAVQARDAAGNVSSQATLNVGTAACTGSTPPPSTGDTQAPTTPSGLASSNVAQTSLTLSWNASSDNVAVTGYDVYRDGTKVASPTSTNANLSGLACATSYAFAVKARDAAGNVSSQASLNVGTAACSGSTPPPPPPVDDTHAPTTPSGLTVSSATASSVSLDWNASTDDVGVGGYRMYRDNTFVSSTTDTSATVSGLVCGHAYTFGVDAFDAAGNASSRATVVGATLACADTSAPSVPTNIVASSRTATSIALTWSASNDNVGVTGYGLYRGGTQVGTSSGTTGIFSGLTCNTNYTLALDAYDAAGNHSSKVTLMVSTTACPDTTPPTAPSGLAASNITGSSLTLSWNPSSDNTGVSGYDVYENGAKVANVSSTSAPQTGLSCGTSYTFGVVARDAAGNSSATASLNASTAPCPAPTWTSSIADGATIQSGTTWTATVNPTPDSVEFWETPVGGASTKLKTDTSAPYDVVLNLASGNYALGVCAVEATVRTCFPDFKNVSVTAAASVSGSSSPYFVADYANGNFDSPWTLLFSHSSPGWTNLPATQSPDGRVAVVNDPAGGSGHAARFELRDTDPGWPSNPDVQKAQVRTDAGPTWNKSGVSVGDVRWFSTRIYLPYNAAEKFEWAHGGSQPYTALWGLHPSSSTGWGAIQLGWEAYQFNSGGDSFGDKNVNLNFHVQGGVFPENTYSEIVNLLPLTDASGNRIMGNYNRWIDLVWGIKFAPDNTGWLEAWVDGVNVYPRKNRPTMWAGDSGMYTMYGLYRRKDASFPDGGRSVVYFGRTTIGLTKP